MVGRRLVTSEQPWRERR